LSTASLGILILILALAAVLAAMGLTFAGLKVGSARLLEKGRLATGGSVFFTALAALLLLAALAACDFSLKYVYDYSATTVPLPYRLAAFWAGNGGSMLLWTLVLALFSAIVAFSGKKLDAEARGAVIFVLQANMVFFLVSMLLFANPFLASAQLVAEGRGLNPMLRNPWMVSHPLALYLGYVGCALPFAFSLAWLWLKRADDGWIRFARPWLLLAWLFLSVGNLLGAQWAYIELGWGGYWAWDPVENASFLPWLTASACLHSVIVQERKGLLKLWNLLLVTATYWLTLYGTFLVRSGVLASVHAFPKSSLSYWFGFFLCLMLAWAAYLLVSRRHLLRQAEGSGEISLLSREGGFLMNNIILVTAGLVIFLGTNLPIFSRILTGVEKAVGKDWFNRTAGPVLLAAILLLGCCAFLDWRRTEPARLWRRIITALGTALIFSALLWVVGVRNLPAILCFAIVFLGLISVMMQTVSKVYRRSGQAWGGILVHLGLVLFTLGVIGDGFYSLETVKTVQAGESISIGRINDYRITFSGVQAERDGVNDVIFTQLAISKNGRDAGTLRPEKVYYPNWENPRSNVAIMGGPVEDLYVVLAGWDATGQQGTLEIHVNPLLNWLWIGGGLVIAGALLALWPWRPAAGIKAVQ